MKAKIQLGEKDDIYKHLNVSEEDSNFDNAMNTDDEYEESEEEYNEIDFRYGLIDK